MNANAIKYRGNAETTIAYVARGPVSFACVDAAPKGGFLVTWNVSGNDVEAVERKWCLTEEEAMRMMFLFAGEMLP